MIVSLAVDSSIRLPSKKYLIEYKKQQFHYISSEKIHETDKVNFFIKTEKDLEDAYSKIREFLCAFAFISQGKIRIGNYCTFGIDSLEKFKGGYSEKKGIPIDQTVRIFPIISDVNTEEKSQLLQLYLEAFSNPNVYFKILFYWHTIIYPSKDEKDGMTFINQNLKILDKEIQTELAKHADIGKYVKLEIRNAIAHIVREKPSYFSLKAGDLNQLHWLTIISYALERIARYRLEAVYNLSAYAPYENCKMITQIK